MNFEEQQSLQALREQNLMLLEQLRRGQHAMKTTLSSTSSSHLNLPSSGSYGAFSSTNHDIPSSTSEDSLQMPRSQSQPSSLHTPKKNVSFSERDLSHIIDFESEASPARAKLAKRKSPKKARSPKQALSQGIPSESPSSIRRERPNLISDTMTSTPNSSAVEKRDTPRSILKRRKIIDDNIRVDSQFAHTPTFGRSPKDRRGLNYSYSEYDDLNDRMKHMEMAGDILGREGTPGKHMYSDATDGSYIEEYLDTSVGDVERDLQDIKARRTEETAEEHKPSKREVQAREVEALLRERLKKDSGNDRAKASVVRDLSKRPKSAIFDSTSGPKVVTHASKTKSPKQSPRRKKSPGKSKSSQGKTVRPLLGYDWIAGVLENDSVVMNNSDDYFDDILKFRKSNKNECTSTTFNPNLLDLTKPIEPEIKSPGHTCIHGYTISDRLFTEPMNVTEEGASVCPVCLIPRKDPNPQEPGFVRVSIPRSTLESPYKVKPHRRRSFDPTDSCALSSHCLSGWECSKPSQLPAASSVDLRQASDGIKGKQSFTISDSEREAMSFSRSAMLFANNPPNGVNLSKNTTSSILDSTTTTTATANGGGGDTANMSQFGRRNFTESLLNTSHGLRFDLQQLEQKDSLALRSRDAPHSTKYPLL